MLLRIRGKNKALNTAGEDIKSVQTLWKSGWNVLNIEPPRHLVLLLLILHPKDSNLLARDTCIAMLIAVLFTAAEGWCQQRYPTIIG